MNESVSPIPKVSVIIPLYNKAPYIKRALDSVLAQTVQDFEIVVVGGNSSDGGEDIVKGYTDSRIRFIQEAGKGVSAARNQGVDAAKAELVAFLDADDEWLPEFLETILRLRGRWPEAGLYGTGYKRILPDGREINCSLNGINDTIFFFNEELKSGYMIIGTSEMAIPKKVFQMNGGFPEGYPQNEDDFLRFKIALNHDVAYDSKICSIYYWDIQTTDNRFSSYVAVPILDYFVANKNQLIKREDYDILCRFCWKWSLDIILRNLKWNASNKLYLEKIRLSLLNLPITSRRDQIIRNYLLFTLKISPKYGIKGYYGLSLIYAIFLRIRMILAKK